MLAINTWSPPSSVYFSERLHDNALVIAKSNRIEVLHIAPLGLVHQCGLDIWGTVSSLQIISGENKNRILVTTDHPKPTAIVLDYVEASSKLVVAHTLSLSLRSGRPVEFFQGALVHPSGSLAAVASYEGHLKVIRFGAGHEVSQFDCRMPEFNILSMCFLPEHRSSSPLPPSEETYVLSILYVDHKLARYIVSRSIDLSEKGLSIEPYLQIDPIAVQSDAETLIPIPGSAMSPGGMLVFGGGMCQFIETVAPIKETAKLGKRRKSTGGAKQQDKSTEKGEPNRIVTASVPIEKPAATTLIDADGSRVVCSDEFGRLYLLALVYGEDSRVSKIESVSLGEISSPTTLTYLTHNVLYVGSHYGDSQLVQLQDSEVDELSSSSPLSTSSDSSKSYLKLLKTFKSLAPISDAVITTADGSDQVTTCSGAYNSGSLKVIRKGADFEELAIVPDLPHVTTIFPLRMNYYNSHDQFMLLSTPYDTRLMELQPNGTMEELDSSTFSGLVRDTPTIAAGNLLENGGEMFVQVTNEAVNVINLTTGVAIPPWRGQITVADVNPTQIVVALRGGDIVHLTYREGMGLEVQRHVSLSVPTKRNQAPKEISALSINPIFAKTPTSSNLVAVAFWGSNDVKVLLLPDLVPIKSIGLAPRENVLPRSVLLHSFSNRGEGEPESPYLLVGLSDGTLVIYGLDPKMLNATSRRLVNLGTMPLRLTPYRHGSGGGNKLLGGARDVVFVSGNRPAVLFVNNGRVQHSPIVLKDVGTATMLNSKDYPNSLVFAAKEGLVIGRLLELSKLHIRSIPYGLDNPRCITHDPVLKAFGVGFLRLDPDPERSGRSISTAPSTFRVLDELTFEPLASFFLDQLEEITCVASLELSANDEEPARYFVVGTEQGTSSAREIAEQGRILVYRTQSSDNGTSGKTIELCTSLRVAGCVSSLAVVDNNLVASINASVIVYQLTSAPSQPIELQPLSTWTRSYIVQSIRVVNNLIVVADALRAIDILRWTGSRLVSVARDYSSLWPISLAALDAETSIVAEGQGNLFTYRLEDGTLEQAGRYHLGEQVTRFDTNLSTASVAEKGKPSVAVAKSLFTTASGRIGIVSELLDADYAVLLTKLQRNLAQVIKGAGNSDHAKWRSPRGNFKDQDAAGFIDGDFVERFLELDPSSPQAHQALQGRTQFEALNQTYEEVAKALEQLQSLH